jgi:hypothetical protein
VRLIETAHRSPRNLPHSNAQEEKAFPRFPVREFIHRGNFSFTTWFPIEKLLSMDIPVLKPTGSIVAEGLRSQLPIKGLLGVSIQNVREQPEQPFDISFELCSGPNQVQVLGEIKPTFSPRLLEEIGPWIRRLKSLRTDISVAVLAPLLSPQAQAFCLQNGIDFLDLAGNVFINVPGKFTLQRSGMRAPSQIGAESQNVRSANVFSGRFSRVLRVLLQNPKSWTVTEIARELEAESTRFSERFPKADVDFKVSLGSVSKAVASLEEQLGVRRRGTAAIVAEPLRLLQQWGEKYKERYRWRLRSSFQTGNPFGRDLGAITKGIDPLMKGAYAFSGAIAAASDAPFVDIDVVDIFVLSGASAGELRDFKSQPSTGPTLRFIVPYDAGVFMYSKQVGAAPVVSPIQSYLDLYARGGRDLKQAEYLLTNVIQPQWRTA